jgi:hypothetical protein
LSRRPAKSASATLCLRPGFVDVELAPADIGAVEGRDCAVRLAVLQIANGEGGAEVSPARTSCGDAINLVDEPDLPDNIALG